MTDLCLIRVRFTLKALVFDDNGGVNRYTGGHVTPLTSTIVLQSSAKFENTMWEFQIACQYDMFNNSAGGCGMREGEVGFFFILLYNYISSVIYIDVHLCGFDPKKASCA